MLHPSYDEREEGEDQAKDKNTPVLYKGKNPGEQNQGHEEIRKDGQVYQTSQKRLEDKPQDNRNEQEEKSPEGDLDDRNIKLLGHTDTFLTVIDESQATSNYKRQIGLINNLVLLVLFVLLVQTHPTKETH